ncbi:MAG: Hsp70 family protein [Phaeodactylibacter xiamenensis]|uniref:Heat shock protein Hsp70 n=1 Tax=Phaeodactylibacter xiamenensis TaxID=1524460 RepID=A0A098S1R5_9BACT|nr:Hsp70 family protein [Phaeodactylibacter xiamenensis]KGE86289.1 heat shock protein Hsp70 [Phaeodactylibacter xiamenensis]MCR9052894.1 Hsp70 family protein [bacterium]
MTRTKIDYGIDLGTTNSAIARMEQGDPIIKKSDTLKDTMPSCVGFNKKGATLVGDSAFNNYKSDKLRSMKGGKTKTNTFIEFKRTMGTDKTYSSSHMNEAFNSEQLSAEVLKKLKSFITDENLQSAVITVPAKFEIRQRDATLRAAKLAGFKYAELLQEPIAASMAYGLNSQNKNGYWVVFDFGGGTFDAALVKVEDGIMQVKDTDGDNYLGGKNLDAAIVDEIIIPYLEEEYVIDSILEDNNKKQILQYAMKYYAEEAKIQLSFKEEHNILSDLGDIPGEDDEGEEFELDITINRERLKEAIAPVFQRAIDITKDLIQRNNLSGGKLDALILVGGPTHSPILREMLEEQIKKPDTSADPMTAVATGAALYASTMDVSDEVKEASRDQTKIQLDIGYEPSTVELEEFVTLKMLPEKTEGGIPASVFAEIVRGDKAWSSGKVSINEKGEMIEAKLNEGKPNNFQILLYDVAGNRLECQPDNFTVIQGSKVGSATLPYNIGVEIKRGRDGKLVFRTVKGLEVNQSLPAKGIINGLKTQQQIRPGNAQDTIEIPIYQGDYYSEGSRALYNEHVYDARITGDDLPALLPERSYVDLTLITDKSGRIEKIEAFFPYLDHTVDIEIPETVGSEIDAAFLDKEIRKAKGALSGLAAQGLVNRQEIESTAEEIERLKQSLDQSRNDYDRKKEVLNNLKKSLRKIDELEDNIEWPQFEKELREEFDRLEGANEELGNEKTTQHVNQLRTQVDEVIRKKDLKLGQSVLEEVHNFFIALTFIYQLIGVVRHFRNDFDRLHWRDPQQARQLLGQATQIIADNPTKERLHPIVVQLFQLLPESEVPDGTVLTE